MIRLVGTLTLLSAASAWSASRQPAAIAPGKAQVPVFVLHSYAQEYPWTRGQHQGFMAALQADKSRGYDVRVEYLDTKRVAYGPAYAQLVAEHLRRKYADYRPAAVYVSDDNALSFAIEHIASIFPDAPVIFSGVNNYSVRSRLDPARFTGVFERKEIAPNLALLGRISPQYKRIVVVGDASETYRAIESEVRAELAGHPEISASFASSDRIEDLLAQLERAGARFVFLTTIGAVANAEGRNLTLPETLRAIADSGDFVILSMEDVYLQPGVLGGWVTSGPRQGRVAAEILRRHLSGQPLEALPPIENSPNGYVFDDRELARIGLELPHDIRSQATHINQLPGFYEANRGLILGTLYTLAALMVVGLVLTVLMYARKNRLVTATAQRLELAHGELQKREKLLQEMGRTANIGGWEIDLASGNLEWTEEVYRIHETGPEYRPEISSAIAFYVGDSREIIEAAVQNAIDKGTAFDLELQIETAKGRRRWVHAKGAARRHRGKPVAVFGTFQDITERRRAEVGLQRAASVFTHAREGIFITDAAGSIVEVNETFSQITGYAPEEVLGKNPRLLKSDQHSPEFYAAMWHTLEKVGNWTGEIWNRRKNGETYPEMLTISAVRDAAGEVMNYVALFSDITPIKAHEQQLEHIAHYDTLTDIPNRVLLADRLQQAMAQTDRRGQSLAVAYLDLDGFKPINDEHGHSVGDELLIAVAQRLKTALREGDTLARMGGDEFVAVLVDLAGRDDYEPVLARLLRAASDPVRLGDVEMRVSASIGVTLYPQDAVDAEQLLRHADQAMYIAKQAGKNRYHVFDVDQDVAVKTRHEKVERIERALAQREFVLYYQPKVNMRTGSVVGAEALIRWQHPSRGLLPPGAFLPDIEDHSISVGLGEWVIDTALTQMESWQAAGFMLPVSVNVAARQLQQQDFTKRLAALLADHRAIAPGRLELEILETSTLDDVVQVSALMRDCGELGVHFSLDDFGTGYSSLTYLKRLPAEMLKIDRSFVRDMLEDPEDLAIVNGVIGLAAAFRREVIAEGVETVAHGTRLLSLGCELAQGYGIARPMPATELAAWAQNWMPDPAWRPARPVVPAEASSG